MTVRIPLLQEQIEIGKRTVETGRVRVSTSVVERLEQVDVPLQRDDVEVRRVSINRKVDHPVATRQEGNVTIVSLHEEVMVVTRQLMLTEELHISKRSTEFTEPHSVTLRQETVDIQRVQPEPGAAGELTGSTGHASVQRGPAQ